MVSSYLTFSPLPAEEKPSTGGLFSVALSLPHDRPPLTATLPQGVRTFLAPAPQKRGRDRSLSSRNLRLQMLQPTPVEHTRSAHNKGVGN